MFNLKQVYATINFERSKIKILIVEKTVQKTNCLYYDEICLTYLDENMHFINIGELHNKLTKLIKAADNFMGVNVKRYIVNIACLPLNIKFCTSAKFLVFDQILTWDHYNNYINKIKKLNSDTKEQILHVNPKKWFLDDHEYESFPLSNSGNDIHFEYYALGCNREITRQWHDLIDALKIKTIGFTNNSLGWSSLFKNDQNKNNVVIDMKSKNSIVTIYKDNEIIDVITYQYGSIALTNNIKEILKIDKSIDISSILHNLNNLNYVNEQIGLINKYDEKFLSITEINSFDMKKCLVIVFKKIINDIYNTIICKINNANKIYLNVNDEMFNCIDLINFDLLKLPIEIELLRNDIIGLEEKNVYNLLSSINYVYEMQMLGEFEYSIDNFVSQEMSFAQTKQNILLKLGLISTKWAAKLGE